MALFHCIGREKINFMFFTHFHNWACNKYVTKECKLQKADFLMKIFCWISTRYHWREYGFILYNRGDFFRSSAVGLKVKFECYNKPENNFTFPLRLMLMQMNTVLKNTQFLIEFYREIVSARCKVLPMNWWTGFNFWI